MIFVIRFINLTIKNAVFTPYTNYRGYILSGQDTITRKSGGEKINGNKLETKYE